jgi:hypothetical protein
MLAGTPIYIPGHMVASAAWLEDLDAPRRCEITATVAAERFGLDVMHGFILVGETVETAEAVQHYWNAERPLGRMIDAALGRRRPIGYLGKQLTDSERETISRMRFLSAVG